MRVVAEAEAGDFVGTRRLEEGAGGAYTWRNILLGVFRSTPVAAVFLVGPVPPINPSPLLPFPSFAATPLAWYCAPRAGSERTPEFEGTPSTMGHELS